MKMLILINVIFSQYLNNVLLYSRMEIYREVCCALERLYERSAEGTGTPPSDTHALSPADANYQVTTEAVV